MSFHPWIKEITLRSGLKLELSQRSVVFAVGPNNGGKSTFIREVRDAIREHYTSLWFQSVEWDRGSAGEYGGFIRESLVDKGDPHNLFDPLTGQAVHRVYVEHFHTIGKTDEAQSKFLVRVLNAHERIKAADPVEAVDRSAGITRHPYHQFYADRDAELAFSTKITEAFGYGCCINRTGRLISAHLGIVPDYDRLPLVDYENSIFETMKPISEFGDGVRCYAGIVLNLNSGRSPVVTIDEPEAFLHPPQARRLGLEIGNSSTGDKQLFVATHSTDILQGAISSTSSDIQIIYVDHLNEARPAHIISSADVRGFANDPLLSSTGALDSIFYSQSIVCEGEPDIMFFRWALAKTSLAGDLDNWFWISSYGKSYMPHVVRSLSKLGIDAKCVLDIDVLLTPEVLEGIYKAKGLRFPHRRLLSELKTSIQVPPAAEILREIEEQIEAIDVRTGDDDVRSTISKIRRSAESLGKSWVLKRAGLSIIPPGSVYERTLHLLEELKDNGILVLAEGEMENFVRRVSFHGQKWVSAVIEADLLPYSTAAAIGAEFTSLTTS